MRIRLVVLALLYLSLLSSTALAQWTPDKGELRLTLSYQYMNGGDHLFSEPVTPDGSKTLDLGTIQTHVGVVDGEIGITERLAISGSVAFAGSQYQGQAPSPFITDNGQWHSSFQDGRIGARYMLISKDKWVLTPSVSYGFPTTNYIPFGHASLGRDVKELQLRVNGGRFISFSDNHNAYVHASYAYAFMEDKLEEVSVDRSNLFFEFGYFLPRFITVQAFADYQNIHGGIDWVHGPFVPAYGVPLAAEDFWRLGGGISVPLGDRVELFGNVSDMVWGINTHHMFAVTAGVSFSFDVFGGDDRTWP